ncbi:hypothetical protein [Shewanella putrefaciens]|nr:hypothetical protein [Shewanella putrefaciens]MDR6963143.1 hypothetical protein [Shewanella putrefaciens]
MPKFPNIRIATRPQWLMLLSKCTIVSAMLKQIAGKDNAVIYDLPLNAI